jgi:hypothetical protein
MNNKITISACIVVYKEKKLIVALLENIKNFVDEVVLVYDGTREEDLDNTIDLAEDFCQKNHLLLRVFKRPHVGEAEPHRPFSFEQASGEWILWIDADERIDGNTQELKDFLLVHQNITRVRFRWGTTSELNRKYSAYKPVLFKKEANCYFGVPHAKPILLKGEGYDFPYNKIKLVHLEVGRSLCALLSRGSKWAKISAQNFFKPLMLIPKINTTPINEKKFEDYRKKRIKYALLFIFPSAFLGVFRAFKDGKSTNAIIARGVQIFLMYFWIIIYYIKYAIPKIFNKNLS